jgi:hypothetical protein
MLGVDFTVILYCLRKKIANLAAVKSILEPSEWEKLDRRQLRWQ